MISPGKKCIAKKCQDCNFWRPWNLVNELGQQKIEERCCFWVLFDEIPRIRGAIDGLQGGVNEARNRSIDTMSAVSRFLQLAHQTAQAKLIGMG